ncbi:MAG TPA: tetratricopeptide repeat protein [Rhodopila sp.]|uniref:tetratricopeptide repeat protein n=1 Tax=Rhodopila sp. TaxID=2480087 RepID=UPI002CB3ABA5|nr:tetratricopeptide repeat protein [Rhodopila sp.]HVY16498.1 tetratricopeptide repeat protein [Rhodopila sp.]
MTFIAATLAAQPGREELAAGDFASALEPLRAASAQDEAQPATLLNLAIAEDRAGDRAKARRLMRMLAIRLPTWDEPVLRLAESLRAAGEREEAEDTYREVLALSPDRAEAMAALAGLLLLRGEAGEARSLLRRCCLRDPSDAHAWNALGLAQHRLGETAEAMEAFRKAVDLDRTHCGFMANLAETAPDAEAELQVQSAAALIDPLAAPPHVGRGLLLDRLGRRSEAIDALDTAVALAPDDVVPLGMLGGLLARSTRVKEAEAALRRLCALTPDDPKPHNDLAAVLMRLHRHAEARTILRDLVDRFGPHPSVLCNMANATTCLGRQAEGVALARQASSLAPDAVLSRRALCNNLPYLDGIGGAELLAAMRACSDVQPRADLGPLANGRDPDRRLTVGLLSGSFRSHPVGWLTVAGIETLDPDAFSIVCLAQNTAANDPLARRYRAVAAEWIEVDTLSDVALAELARGRGIDILIDLGGYGDAGRMNACAHRLAPVQVKWVGMQSHSSGLAEMDWFVSDHWETPDGFERFYSERLMRLPDGYVCYTPPPHAPDVAPLPALRNGFVTFGCFNNLAKITPRVVETWSRILHRVPDSRIVLKTHQLGDADTVAGMRAAFELHGIDPDRVECRGSSGHRAFMGQYGDIDLVLDPFPYSGGLTTCEALWMGVPTITLPGEIFASRHSASHMSNAGLADWVVGSLDAYVEMAERRAGDLGALALLRAELREQVRSSPLCDAPRFGRNLGAALRTAWRDWCRSGA